MSRIPRPRATTIKFVAFLVLCSALGSVVIGTLLNQNVGTTDTYHAIFHDVSGLRSGDPVRVSGVVVGTVGSESLLDATHVKVTFTANRHQQLTTSTNAVVRYANLLGQRFLALTQVGKPGSPLHPGDSIPVNDTAPALSLTALFNGFQPIFQSLTPDQINQLSGEIVQVLQGEGGTVDDLFAQTAELTSNLADRDKLFEGVIDSFTKLLGTVSQHDSQLASMLVSLQGLTGSLAADSPHISASLTAVDQLMTSVGTLLSGLNGGNLHNDALDLNAITATLAKNQGTIDATINAFPKTFGTFDRLTQNGNWVNLYACNAQATVKNLSVTATQVTTLVADYLGGGSLTSTVTMLLGQLIPHGLSVPLPITAPEGAVGNPNTHTAVCP